MLLSVMIPIDWIPVCVSASKVRGYEMLFYNKSWLWVKSKCSGRLLWCAQTYLRSLGTRWFCTCELSEVFKNLTSKPKWTHSSSILSRGKIFLILTLYVPLFRIRSMYVWSIAIVESWRTWLVLSVIAISRDTSAESYYRATKSRLVYVTNTLKVKNSLISLYFSLASLSSSSK